MVIIYLPKEGVLALCSIGAPWQGWEGQNLGWKGSKPDPIVIWMVNSQSWSYICNLHCQCRKSRLRSNSEEALSQITSRAYLYPELHLWETLLEMISIGVPITLVGEIERYCLRLIVGAGDLLESLLRYCIYRIKFLFYQIKMISDSLPSYSICTKII